MRVLTSVTFILALTLLIVQAFFSVRGIVSPVSGATGFGFPTDSPSAEFYHAVYRDRNLVLSLIGFILLVMQEWKSLAVVFVVSTTLPLYDIVALKNANVPVLPLHYITFAVLAIISGLIIVQAKKAR